MCAKLEREGHDRYRATVTKMAIDSIQHTFFDIDVEHVGDTGEFHLIKILSIDGRRFTYELRAPLTEEAVAYIKSLLDAVVFGDLIIEQTSNRFEARESQSRLKKHS
jgi:hypothetical protein